MSPDKNFSMDSEQRFKALIENSADAISLIDATGKVLYESPSYERIMGYAVSDRLGRNTFELVHPEDRQTLQHMFSEVLVRFEPIVIQPIRVRHGDGTWRWIEGIANNMLNVSSVKAIVINFRDITDRRLAEEALKESQTRLRLLSDNLPGGMVYQIDSGLQGERRDFTYISAGVFRLHGVTPAAALADSGEIYRQVYDEDAPRLAQLETEAFESMKVFEAEVRFRMPSGELRWSYLSSSPRRLDNGQIVWDGIEIDIAEKIKLQESAQRADKLEALGLLAGGIAHDFNNLLSGIYGYLDLALLFAEEPKVREYLENTVTTMNRARALTMQLLTFSKGGVPIRQVHRLNTFLEETVKFALSGSNVSCRFDLEEHLWQCEFDKNQIAQVIDNLVINAQQAMPLGGTITISCRNISIRKGGHPQLRAGDYIRLSIEDHGIGIPAENMFKIFDPFFSTKTKGHGLGLATCYSIIKRHDGCIEVQSQLGKGSIFHVFLPAVKDFEQSDRIVLPPSCHQGSGTVLVMDDEAVIRNTVRAMLTSFGYTVMAKENGSQAIECFQEAQRSATPLKAYLFDLTVAGGMGGCEAIREIRKSDPSTPAFVMSGYAEDPIMAFPAEYGFTASICKPFSVAELAQLFEHHLVRSTG